jgi:hypothetical protein
VLISSDNLDSLVPRLYPLLRHNLVSVRISSIQTFDELINGPNSKWIEPILSDLLRYIFQNIILERNDTIISESFKTWNSLMKVVSGEKLLTALNDVIKYWIYLLATPFGCQFDVNLMLLPESVRYSLQNSFNFFINFKVTTPNKKSEKQTFSIQLNYEDTEDFIKMRVHSSKALSIIAQTCSKLDLSYFYSVIESLFASNSASHKQISALIVEEMLRKRLVLPEKFMNQFITILENEPIIYAEAEQYHNALHHECVQLLIFYKSVKMNVSHYLNVTIDNSIATKLIQEEYQQCLTLMKDKSKIGKLETLKESVSKSLDAFKNMTMILHSLVLSNVSCAVVYVKYPLKIINSIIRSLLNSIQTQRSVILQERSSQSLTHVIIQSLKIERIVKVILDTLSSKLYLTIPSNQDKKEAALNDEEISHRGCQIALQNITRQMGIYLIEKLPHLWSLTGGIFLNIEQHNETTLENSLYLFKTIAPTMEHSLFSNVEPVILKIISIISGNLQMKAAETIGVLCRFMTKPCMNVIINQLIPLLDDKEALKRRGAAYIIESIPNPILISF